MQFSFDQHIAAAPDVVARVYTDPAFYETVGARDKLDAPELLSCATDGDRVSLRVRYRFVGDLSSAVRAAIDPAKLTWVEESEHDLARQTTTFRMRADHYADRFDASGRCACVAVDGGGTRRHGSGELKIRFPLVGSRVEAAIVSGLKEHLASEPPVVEAYIAAHPPSG